MRFQSELQKNKHLEQRFGDTPTQGIAREKKKTPRKDTQRSRDGKEYFGLGEKMELSEMKRSRVISAHIVNMRRGVIKRVRGPR